MSITVDTVNSQLKNRDWHIVRSCRSESAGRQIRPITTHSTQRLSLFLCLSPKSRRVEKEWGSNVHVCGCKQGEPVFCGAINTALGIFHFPGIFLGISWYQGGSESLWGQIWYQIKPCILIKYSGYQKKIKKNTLSQQKKPKERQHWNFFFSRRIRHIGR